MICKHCGAEVPEGKLVCDCFYDYVQGDLELEQRAIEMFERGLPLVLTKGGKHLIGRTGKMVFCGTKRYKTKAPGIDFERIALDNEEQLKRICQKCLAALRSRMKQPA